MDVKKFLVDLATASKCYQPERIGECLYRVFELEKELPDSVFARKNKERPRDRYYILDVIMGDARFASLALEYIGLKHEQERHGLDCQQALDYLAEEITDYEETETEVATVIKSAALAETETVGPLSTVDALNALSMWQN